MFQVSYNQVDVQQNISLADEAVSVIRSANVESELGFTGKTSLSAFKPGPLLISLTVNSDNQMSVQTMLNKSSDYLRAHYQLTELGQDVITVKNPNLLLGIGAGLIVGFLLASLISLLREYFRNF